MSKRANGDGSIYRVKDGGGWMASVSFLDAETGQFRRRRRRARTKTEAVRHLKSMQRELEDFGQFPDSTRPVARTVEDYLTMRAGRALELGAREADRWAMRLIEQGLGDRTVASLSVADCDQFLTGAAAGRFGGPLGRDQLKRLRSRLVNAIENDRRRGLVTRNVAELSVIPDTSPMLVPRRPRRAIAAVELQSLLEVAKPVVAVLIDLSGRHGLRPAEARGLRWSRVDLESRTVQVDAQINRRNEIVKVKTKRSFRTIRVDTATVGRLSAWRDTQLEMELAAGPAWSGNQQDLIATTAFGTAINQRNVHRSLAVACQQIGIEPAISGYDLRHTAITFQVEKGHPVHQIADWAGTSERMILDVYRHRLLAVADLGAADA